MIRIKEIENKYEGCNYGTFKKAVADVVCSTLEEIQSKYHEVLNSGKLEEVFKLGAEKARYIAHKKLMKVQNLHMINIIIKYKCFEEEYQ